MSVHSIFSSVLLALQLLLGLWQIGKLTPAGALIQCSTSYLLHLLGLPSIYSRLKHIKGHVYKTVRCTVTMVAYQPIVPIRRQRDETSEIKSSYLCCEFLLERKNGNKLFVDGKMSYYITDTIWSSLLDMGNVASKTLFLKGYKEYWQQVATGGVMSLTEVLDCLILENQTIRKLDNDLLLPVDLSVSEEKLLKVLNLMGLFLRTKQVYWPIPTLLSFTSAVLEFNPSVRVWLYSKVNLVVCWAAHHICDPLPRSIRRQVYSFGSWVENLKPCNDIELRVVRGTIKGVIGGGVKTHNEGATLVKHDDPKCSLQEEKIEASTVALANVDCNRDGVKTHNEGTTLVEHDDPKCALQEEKIEASTVALAIVDCNTDGVKTHIEGATLVEHDDPECSLQEEKLKASTVALANVDCSRDGVKTHNEGATLVEHDDPECSLQEIKIEASTVALANVDCSRDGVKTHNEGATSVEHDDPEFSLQEEKFERSIRCCNIIDIEAVFYPNESTCHVRATTVALADVDCNRDEFTKLWTFLSCVARNGSGSLKSCGENNKVRVRGFRESVLCYAINGFPPVYELKLDHVVVE